MRQKITKAVIPAAGYGTRMLPATKVLPKEMLPVAGKPLIQYAVQEAAASGIETVVLVVRKHGALLQSYFAPDPELENFLRQRQLHEMEAELDSLRHLVNLEYIEQTQPLGLAHAICVARPLLGDQPFAVLLPDVIMVGEEPVTAQLIRACGADDATGIAVREVEPHQVQRHGIIKYDRTSFVSSSDCVPITGLVEKPSLASAPSRLGVFGRYVLAPSIWNAIDQTRADATGEVQLTDALDLLCRAREYPVRGVFFTGSHYDAGDRLGYLTANIELTLRDERLRQPCLDYLARLQIFSVR
jgi:UTP--glucose-1-phosphate uridylyltransferase